MSVSTEVQRTLVKSPPELWAELSDPAALARHLSELGEIRITRTEPERVVEWEAAALDGAKASGKVEISPSGWGTKVTFSATRAVAPADPSPTPTPSPDAPSPPASPAFAPSPPAPSTLAPSTPVSPAFAPSPPAPSTLAPSTPVSPALASSPPQLDGEQPHSPDDPDDGIPHASLDTPVAHEASPSGPPAPSEPPTLEDPSAYPHPLAPIEALEALDARDLPGEDDSPADSFDDPLDDAERDNPDSHDDLEADEDLESDDDLGDEDEVLAQAGPPADRERGHPGTRARQPQQRRGFFARLFGFRRRVSQTERDGEPDAHGRPVALQDEPDAEFARQLPGPELPSALALAEQATESYEAVGVEPPDGACAAEPRADELGERDAALLAEAHAAELRPLHPEPLHCPAESPSASPGSLRDAGEAPSALAGSLPAHGETQAVEPQAAQHAEPQAAVDQPPVPDIPAELRAAEEAAGAQVTAVLTSALDRLGAAHHRPFSRA